MEDRDARIEVVQLALSLKLSKEKGERRQKCEQVEKAERDKMEGPASERKGPCSWTGQEAGPARGEQGTEEQEGLLGSGLQESGGEEATPPRSPWCLNGVTLQSTPKSASEHGRCEKSPV